MQSVKELRVRDHIQMKLNHSFFFCWKLNSRTKTVHIYTHAKRTWKKIWKRECKKCTAMWNEWFGSVSMFFGSLLYSVYFPCVLFIDCMHTATHHFTLSREHNNRKILTFTSNRTELSLQSFEIRVSLDNFYIFAWNAQPCAIFLFFFFLLFVRCICCWSCSNCVW